MIILYSDAIGDWEILINSKPLSGRLFEYKSSAKQENKTSKGQFDKSIDF